MSTVPTTNHEKRIIPDRLRTPFTRILASWEVLLLGVAILIFTVFVKLLFFPLANTSYRAMSKMKKLQPEMERLRERFKDDKVQQQQEMMKKFGGGDAQQQPAATAADSMPAAGIVVYRRPRMFYAIFVVLRLTFIHFYE